MERARNNSDISEQSTSQSKQNPTQSSQKLTPPKSQDPNQPPISRGQQFLAHFQQFSDQETEFYERKVVDPATELKVIGETVATVVGTELIAVKALGLAAKTLRFSKIPKFSKSLVGLAKEAPEVRPPKLTKQRITKYLEQVHEVPREQLVQDLESIGLKKAEGSKTDGVLDDKFLKFKHKTEKFQVEIHEAHPGSNGAKHPHLHIKDKQGQPLNKDLAPVDRKSPEAHIKIHDIAPKLDPKGKP